MRSRSMQAFIIIIVGIAVFGYAIGSQSIAKADDQYKDDWVTNQWVEGMWWTTESHILLNASNSRSGSLVLVDKIFLHRWVVEKSDEIDGEQCWVIKVYPHKLPEGIVDEQTDKQLCTIFISKKTRSLRRYINSSRGGSYSVTGEEINFTIDYPKPTPAIVTQASIPCSIDLPVLPAQWYTDGLVEADKASTYTDNITNSIVSQFVQPFSQEVTGKIQQVQLITLSRKDIGTITQTWTSTCPWWTEWRCQKPNGKQIEFSSVWFSKTIDWKGK